ncbi:prespore-specific protein [Dictyostelium discoideum AX4]|uniref:Prespore-specific protein n=1 Tax=Dictyostelium discoideum TaxID=44689 RepID=Q9BI24_DICDI|nr:prespore-specific protein [Dictyostelium discoideum AX4]XP_645032.1 prespore-specific protein [Dictyostelium discoideum AX4]EAL70456.1 prespore-specific protein [Dictyostelium discoideum AX4]EAL71035.1 prespore-specific protein [Dictyostelium discoideum AX4]CAC34056.1 prespore-specific protein 3B [Dictyostelium discoideum]|eukprot:XP_644381.1 prespore-specific protein [Dictyostelium discoideum AX4]
MLTFKQLKETEKDFTVDENKFRVAPSNETLMETVKNLEAKNHRVSVVENEADALNLLLNEIPKGSEVMCASSCTIDEIGFKKIYFSDDSPFVNVHKKILALPADKQADARKDALTSQYFLSSVTAISKTGNVYVADASGTRVGGFTAAKNLIIVSGYNKIVDSDELAVQRTEQFCLPCESVRARWAYKVPGSMIQNLLGMKHGAPNKHHIILIKKLLGY